ncbi:PQQ-binding-like beta-propeller repeat protein [Bradyrhizobium archetypum]|uniref:PQQ-binding-like beta-propeller repeat protein n=1 Tax=Bradyrhizobium archetypum TaxID=2721160 RepID=A0A7Y4GZI6_9BRAD|nr:PQQ-binding-like beta-propeller repeat protein [Bradyrhizobium archetypum]NOJ44726.1 PQQ-binding-like beta-propeller repeat protein [Bradyrhizobium archetypum]
MDVRDQLFNRVREDAESIAQVTRGLNFPLAPYLDQTDLNALCDAVSLEPDQWATDDLERILLLRDGLYDLRQNLRDKGDNPEAEHSVDQVLGGLDRLYADFDRALRELERSELVEAQSHLTRLREGPRVSSAALEGEVQDLRAVATEVLTQAQITQRSIEINIFRVDHLNVNLEFLKNAKLNVKRLSASVFNIKLSLEQNVIFQGIFRFLNDGADRVLAELAALGRQLQKVYAQSKDFLAELSKLSETGGRFTRLVSSFLTRVFGDQPTPEMAIDLKQQTALSSSPILCGTLVRDKLATLCGRDGTRLLLDTSTMRLVDQAKSGDTINDAVVFEDWVAAGTTEGLELFPSIGRVVSERAPYRENVVAVAVMPWGALSEGEVITGSRDGTLRRWEKVANLSQVRSAKVSRHIQKLKPRGKEQLLVASREEVLLVDEDLEVLRRIPVNFMIKDMAVVDNDTLIVCGPGSVAHVNLGQGIYSRLIGATTTAEYAAVAVLADGTVCAGTEDGKLMALDFNSGEELGMVDLGFQVRGLITVDRRILAYGGAWNNSGRGKSIAFVTWQKRALQVEHR